MFIKSGQVEIGFGNIFFFSFEQSPPPSLRRKKKKTGKTTHISVVRACMRVWSEPAPPYIPLLFFSSPSSTFVPVSHFGKNFLLLSSSSS